MDGDSPGRQGGFDRYDFSFTVKPYAIDLQSDEHTLEVRANNQDEGPCVAVNAFDESGEDRLRSDGSWSVDGAALRLGPDLPPGARHTQGCQDPASAQRIRRRHPLPAAEWLDGHEREGTRFLHVSPRTPSPPTGGHEEAWEYLRFRVPAGARAMHVPSAETRRVWIDGEPLEARGPRIELTGADDAPPSRVSLLGFPRSVYLHEGVLLDEPVAFEVGEGRIDPAGWCERGLADFSGTLVYETSVEPDATPPAARLRAESIRGTVERPVNGFDCGTRAWALTSSTSGEPCAQVSTKSLSR